MEPVFRASTGGVEPKAEVLAAVRLVADQGLQQGAFAAILFGSHARGESYPESDVDITFVGRDRDGILERRSGYLFSIDWRSSEKFRDAMNNPAWAGGAVQGLRGSFIVSDPQGVAQELKSKAHAWTWDLIKDQCDAWVPEQVVSLAEDVQRAFGHHRMGKRWVTTVLKGMLAARLGMILSVHLRILYNSENDLWDAVCGVMGEPWRRAQSAAFSAGDESYRESFQATMRLYGLAVATVHHLMNQRQEDVAVGTLQIIGQSDLIYKRGTL